jgi:hypothetical protein
MQLRCLVAAVVIAAAGCAALDPRAPEMVAADGIVAEILQVARAPAAEQKAALARAEQAFVGQPSAGNRLRLAALLGTLPPPLHDDARAAELLEPIANASKPGGGRLAALLATQVSEHARLGREVERLAQDRERADKERDKREEALRQQVEALRGIERGILEREERLHRRTN